MRHSNVRLQSFLNLMHWQELNHRTRRTVLRNVVISQRNVNFFSSAHEFSYVDAQCIYCKVLTISKKSFTCMLLR